MSAAQIVGIDNAADFIRRYKKLVKIEVFARANDKMPFCVFDSEIEDNLIEALKEFLQTQAENGNVNTLYHIRLVMDGAKKDNVIAFSFAVEAKKPLEPRSVNGVGTSPAFEKINELYLELGQLRTENKRLLELNQDLENEIAELEAEAAEINGPPDPLQKIRPYVELAKELQPLINGFFQRQPIAVNGPGQTDINSLVAEMQTLDTNFLTNFEKLVRLARTKPEVYQIAIQYLNQL